MSNFRVVDVPNYEDAALLKWRVLNLVGNATCLLAVLYLRRMWDHGQLSTMALFWWAWPCVCFWMATVWIESQLRRRNEYYVSPRGFEVEPREKK